MERDPFLIGEVSEAELEAWWGYDLVAPGGLLDRIYRELQVGIWWHLGGRVLSCGMSA